MTDQLRFEPFEASELTEWLDRSRAGYIEKLIAAGSTRTEATASADRSLARTFPGGSPGPGQHVGRLVLEREHIGDLWVGPAGDDPERWWIWLIEIDEAHRGRGHGRQAMHVAEQIAGEAGATTVGLNVLGHNAIARHLYTSLGYGEVSVEMRKNL